MKRFYEGMFAKRLRPAAALREAQAALRRERRWSSPYYWAAFTLQGDWN
jgi:CHAT domain-containing protein